MKKTTQKITTIALKKITLQTTLMDYPISVYGQLLDEGIHVLIVGGSRTHIGAISYALSPEEIQTIQYPKHREGIISEDWARELYQSFQIPITISCGIHYDNVGREEIDLILDAVKQLQKQFILSVREG